jgi:hypothetical protein
VQAPANTDATCADPAFARMGARNVPFGNSSAILGGTITSQSGGSAASGSSPSLSRSVDTNRNRNSSLQQSSASTSTTTVDVGSVTRSSRPPLITTKPVPKPAETKTRSKNRWCEEDETITDWSIVHPYTTTFYGNILDYIPPFPRLTLPTACIEPPRFRELEPTSSGIVPVAGSGGGGFWNGGHSEATSRARVAYWVEDKNPVVVYSDGDPPTYGGQPTAVNDHKEATTNPAGTRASGPRFATSTPSPAQDTRGDGSRSGSTPLTIVVQPSLVIIQGSTFVDATQNPTSTVVVNRDTFVINPSRVIGAGATVTRPPTTQGDNLYIPVQTATAVAGPPRVEVIGGNLITAVGPSILVIHATTLTYGGDAKTTTTAIGGETITIGPSGITAHGSTYGGITADPTNTTYAMVGGATVTGYGSTAAVIVGSTYKIGPGVTGTLTTVVGGQTLTIGPSGVSTATNTLVKADASTTIITRAPSRTEGVAGGAVAATPTSTSGASRSGLLSLRGVQQAWTPITVTSSSLWTLCIAIGVGLWEILLF